MFHPLDLMEPEETVGNLWHGWASRRPGPNGAAVALESVRQSVVTIYRALGGGEACEIVAAPATRRDVNAEPVHVADFCGERLRLPPEIDAFPTPELNRAAYLWLAALAAHVEMPAPEAEPFAADLAELASLAGATARTLTRLSIIHISR